VRVRIAPLGEVVLTHARLRILDATGTSQSELETDIPATRAVTLRLFVEADIAEVFVDDRCSLVARLPVFPGKRRLAIRSDGKRASISRMRISAPEWANCGK
jgi:hypothetical protein